MNKRQSVDSLFNVQTNAVSADLIRIILWGLFEEWDVNSIGYLTPATFQRACRISDISWGSKQSSEVFNLLDCYKYDGKVNFDEFFATMAPFVSSLVDEIQGHPPDDEDFTANLTNMAELLDEAHSRRETHLALEGDNRGDSYSDSSFEDGDEDGGFGAAGRGIAGAADGGAVLEDHPKGAAAVGDVVLEPCPPCSDHLPGEDERRREMA